MSPNAGSSLSGNEIMGDFVVFYVIAARPRPKLSAWKSIMLRFPNSMVL